MEYKQRTGLKRLIAAFGHSRDGFIYAFKSEEAFRQEIYLFVILFPLSFFIGQTAIETILLISGLFAVLITELLNTAVECAIDRISKDYHDLSKASKDIGSTAVLIAVIYCSITWGIIVVARFL
jgi:diacylglycerol kinase (ATP)